MKKIKFLFAVVLMATMVTFTTSCTDKDTSATTATVKVDSYTNINVRLDGSNIPGALPEYLGYAHVIVKLKKGESVGYARAFDASGKKTSGKLTVSVIGNEVLIAFNDVSGNSKFDFTTRKKVICGQYDVYVFKPEKS